MDIGPSFRGFWNMIVSLCFSYPLKVSWYKSLSNGVAWFGICHWWRPKKSRFHPYLLCPDSSLNLLIYEVCPSDWCCPKTVHDSFGGSKSPPTRQRNYMVLMMWMPLPYHLHLARTGWRILQNMARVLRPAIQFSNSAPDVWLKSFLKFVGGLLSKISVEPFCIYGKMWDVVGINGPSFTVGVLWNIISVLCQKGLRIKESKCVDRFSFIVVVLMCFPTERGHHGC